MDTVLFKVHQEQIEVFYLNGVFRFDRGLGSVAKVSRFFIQVEKRAGSMIGSGNLKLYVLLFIRQLVSKVEASY